MRLVLALLAVMALLSSPVTAVAAQAACGHNGPMEMAGMEMSAMPGKDQAGTPKAADPCCDQTSQHGGKRDMSCAQACAAMCGVTVALTAVSYDVVLAPVPADVPAARAVSPHPYKPPGLRRPPKSIA